MSGDCAQEMCENWSGDGRVCPCVLLDLEGDERPIVREDDDAGGAVVSATPHVFQHGSGGLVVPCIGEGCTYCARPGAMYDAYLGGLPFWQGVRDAPPLAVTLKGDDAYDEWVRERWRERAASPSPAECLVAADAVEGAIHLLDDDASAQILARLADQWRAEAASPRCSSCGQPMDSAPCSRNPETGEGGHTTAGGCGASQTSTQTDALPADRATSPSAQQGTDTGGPQ